MIAQRLTRGFHRIGLVVAVPCVLAAIVAAAISAGLVLLPSMMGPIFGIDVSYDEATRNADGSSSRLKQILDEECRGALSAEHQALLHEARRRGLVTASCRSATREAALLSIAIGAVLGVVGLLWYGVMRVIAWVLAGFFG